MHSTTDPADWIDRAARCQPERPFLTTAAGAEMSYESLRRESGRFAAALRRQGVAAGDRVAVQVDKSAEAVLLYVACLRMGAVFVPINVAHTPTEVSYAWRDCGAKLAVIRPADRAALEPHASDAGVLLESLAGLLQQAGEDADVPRYGGAATLAAIVYTSGTTGRSKGAMLTRGNLASNAAVLAEAWHFTGEDVLLHVLPLFHVHGLFAALNTVLASGSALLLQSHFDAGSALRLLPRATVFMGVPTHYTRLLQHADLNREATANMRLFISGSAPLHIETQREFLRRTGHVILERYGMTETLMNTSNPYAGLRKPGSVGVALPGTEIRVADAVTGAAIEAADIVGALEVKGPNVFAGYWQDAEKTRAGFTGDGWFKTHDLGRIDRDGYVHIVGRTQDLVISGGYNVYPKEVETELDALAGVLESAVFGVGHPDFGEGVTAVVVPKPAARLTEADLINALRQRLARYKIPKRVLIIEELPRNTMGKVQKSALRAAYASLYGATS